MSATREKRRVYRAEYGGFSRAREKNKLTVTGENWISDGHGGVFPAFAFESAQVGGFIGAFPAFSAGKITTAALPSEYGGGTIFRDVLVVSSSGGLYKYKESEGAWQAFSDVTFAKPPRTAQFFEANGKECAVIFGGKVYAYVAGGTLETIAAYCYKDLGCVAADRVFFAEDDKTVRFSGVLAKSSIQDSADEGGKTTFPVARGMRGICNLCGDLYVFFAQKVFRVDVKGSARDFQAEEIPYGGGEIFCGSPVSCGNAICFVASDGAYVFDGKSFEKITGRGVRTDFSKVKNCRCIGATGKFLFEIDGGSGGKATNSNESGGIKERYLCDTRTGGFSVLGVDLTYAFSYGDTVYFHADDGMKTFVFDGSGAAGSGTEGSGSASGNGSSGESEEIVCVLKRIDEDFKKTGRKTLRYVTLYGRGRAVLSVAAGSGGVTRAVELKECGVRIKTDVTAEKFSFELRLCGGTYVSGVAAEYAAFERSGRE